MVGIGCPAIISREKFPVTLKRWPDNNCQLCFFFPQSINLKFCRDSAVYWARAVKKREKVYVLASFFVSRSLCQSIKDEE